jgi:predicted NodU family carbamoyl transferase
MSILGVNDGHNANAVLLVDGRIAVGAQEERFRNVTNYGFPEMAIKYVLRSSDLHAGDIDQVALGSELQPRAFDTRMIRSIQK